LLSRTKILTSPGPEHTYPDLPINGRAPPSAHAP
jgi:hypothetical protein